MSVEKVVWFDRYIGLSTDDKPIFEDDVAVSLLPGTQFYETDTFDTYVWDGTEWKKAYTQAVRFVDTNGQTQGVDVVGGVIPVSGPITSVQIQIPFQNLEDMLSDILKELKIMNLHMSLMTDTFINKLEVE